MATTPKRMVGPKQLASSTTTEYTAPAAGAVIRFIHLSNPTTSDKTVTASIGADAAGVRFLDAYTIPASSVFSYPVNIPMTNGEILAMHASSATSVVAVVSGYEQ